MRVLVCGGRAFDDANRVWSVLDYYHAQRRFSFLIHGSATGVDSLASEWAKMRGIEQKGFPADWETFGNAAGPIRNGQMIVDGKPDLVIAFPGFRGTADMCQQAREKNIPVLVVPS